MCMIRNLKTNGEKQKLLNMVYNYLDGNLDEIYEKFKGSKLLSQLEVGVHKR